MRVVVFHRAGSTVCNPEHVPALVREHGRVVVEPLGHTGQSRHDVTTVDDHFLSGDATPDVYRPETATADRWPGPPATVLLDGQPIGTLVEAVVSPLDLAEPQPWEHIDSIDSTVGPSWWRGLRDYLARRPQR